MNQPSGEITGGPPTSVLPRRSASLDITKGLLIFAMLISHAWGGIVYLLPPIDIRYAVTFVTSSYVFVSGYILGKYLLPGYVSKPHDRVKRDLGRALRLYLIFFIPNLALYFTNYRHISSEMSLGDWLIALVVNPVNDIPAFEILYSIAVFMACGSLVLYLFAKPLRMDREVIRRKVGAVALVIGYFLISTKALDRLIGFGFLGLAFGLWINDLSHYAARAHAYSYLIFGTMLVAFVVIFAHQEGSDIYGSSYIPYVAIALLGTYLVSRGMEERAQSLSNALTVLGRHSLVVYLYQVAATRLLSILLSKGKVFDETDYLYAFLIILAAVGSSMILLAQSIESFSSKNPRFRAIYGQVFR